MNYGNCCGLSHPWPE